MGVDLFEKYNVAPQGGAQGGTDLFEKYGVSQQPQQSSGWLPKSFADTDLAKMPGYAMDAARAIDLGAQRFGGNVIQDIGKGLSYLPGNTGIADKLQQAGSLAANLTPQQAGIQNPDAGTSLLTGAAQFAPYGLAASVMPSTAASPTSIPVIRNLIGPMAQKLGLSSALYGASQSEPGNAVGGAIGSGLAGMALADLPGVASDATGLVKDLKGFLTGSNLQAEADTLYNSLAQGKSLSDLNKTNTESVLGNYKANQKVISNGYTNFEKEAANRGYGNQMSFDEPKGAAQNTMGGQIFDQETGALGLPQETNRIGNNGVANAPESNLSAQLSQQATGKASQGAEQAQSPGFKSIEVNQDTSDLLSRIAGKKSEMFSNDMDITDPLRSVSTVLKGTIDAFKKNPTYANAHNLQSLLGNEAADFRSGISTSINDKQTAKVLSDAREQIRNSIADSFKKNGDADLAEQYQSLSDQYKQNVVPYMNVPSVWRAIRGQNYPDNLIKTLEKNDMRGNNQVIRDQLRANPQSSDMVIAQALKRAAEPDSMGNYATTPQQLVKSSNALNDNIKQFMSDDLKEKLGALEDAQRLRSKYAPNLSKALKIATGGVLFTGGMGAGDAALKLLEKM